MLEKSSKIGHSIGEKKSIFRKKDTRREAKIWAKKGGPSSPYPRVESYDFVPECLISPMANQSDVNDLPHQPAEPQ